MTDEANKGGRPRKYAATAERVAETFREAQRLEAERDRLAVEAEGSETMSSKAALLRCEMLLAQAWAAAMRADGKIPAALKFADTANKYAAAHAKAVEQMMHDRVEALHRLVAQRQQAVDALEVELGEEVAP